MALRTIEINGTVTDEHVIVLKLPDDVIPGSYRMVLVLATAAEIDVDVAQDEDPWETFFQIGAELGAQGPISPTASEDLMASRR